MSKPSLGDLERQEAGLLRHLVGEEALPGKLSGYELALERVRLLELLVQNGVGSGGGGGAVGAPVFIQTSQPEYSGAYVWYQPQNDGTYKLFVFTPEEAD